MTKKQNTILFILVGTIVSILITVLIIAVLILLLVTLLPSLFQSVFPFIFIIGVLLGMIIYNKLATFIITKFNLEDKIEPLFPNRKKSSKK